MNKRERELLLKIRQIIDESLEMCENENNEEDN